MHKPRKAKQEVQVDQAELDRVVEADIDFQEHWQNEFPPTVTEGLGEDL